MEKIKVKVYYDPAGNTLTVWFGDPADEEVSVETGEEVLLMKDKHGKVIGFEKLNVAPRPGLLNVQFETLTLGVVELHP
jgi:uncharacterized protein YuzE